MLEVNKILVTEEKEDLKEYRAKHVPIKRSDFEDSIRYASYIQSALLPPIKVLFRQFPNSFIYFEPKNMISGDFYWFTQKQNTFYIAVADCTGHGVPGALMSIMGITFLNEIVNRDCVPKANVFLNIMREKVMKALHQTGDNDQKDGMDIALCIIDLKNHQLQFSGAYNPLYIIRDQKLIEIKGDRMPIGIHAVEETSFKNNYFDLQKDDQLYLFSDGYVDQFGGAEGKKFKHRRLKKMLIDISNSPMFKQYQILHETFYDWKEDLDQIDDVSFIGFKYNK